MEYEMKLIEQNLEIFKLKLDYLRNIGIEDPFDLEMDIMNSMPEFYENFPSIVKRLCREKDQDNSYLYKMINLLKDVEKGEQNLNTVELILGNELAEKFVYPVINKLESTNNKLESTNNKLESTNNNLESTNNNLTIIDLTN
jgi:hypothetical protein